MDSSFLDMVKGLDPEKVEEIFKRSFTPFWGKLPIKGLTVFRKTSLGLHFKIIQYYFDDCKFGKHSSGHVLSAERF
ncbi:MAG: hypothetical protein CM1200mP16_10500 [Nitrospina sp.]|nr:MAG: hypothetical protein CM1200mP16_10500 [Nitrospina sp.]